MDVKTIYDQHKEIIRQMALKMSGKSGQEVDELISIAYLSLTKAVETHNPERGELSHYITFMVRKGWQDTMRKDYWLPHRLETPVETFEGKEVTYQERESEDVNTLIRIALDPPMDVQVNAEVIKKKYSRGVILKLAIIEYLQDLGWAMARIEEGFSEVRELLNG